MASVCEQAPTSTSWIGVMAAAKLARRSPGWIQRQAVIGKVRTLLEPGEKARYAESDILRVAHQEGAVEGAQP
jgi:hypothetical protein